MEEEKKTSPKKYTTKDSGEREEFDTGAKRDTQDGKPRYDLIPVKFLKAIAMHIEEEPDARLDLIPIKPLLRLAALYGRGAVKYGENNYQKGMLFSRVYASLLRHVYQWAEGDKEEDHGSAISWNAFALALYEDMIEAGELPKELNDMHPTPIDLKTNASS